MKKEISYELKINLVLGGIIIVFIIIYIISIIHQNKIIINSKIKYTIGEIRYYDNGGTSSEFWGYQYYVNNKKVRNTHIVPSKYYKLSTDSLRRFKGHRYIVKFYDKLPNKRSTLLLNYEVTNDTLQAPPEGWDKIPPDSILCPTGKK